MSQFWVKQSGGADIYGPYTSDQLRAFAAEGRVQADWLISKDQTTWHPAGRVKGLFPATPAAAPALQPAATGAHPPHPVANAAQPAAMHLATPAVSAMKALVTGAPAPAATQHGAAPSLGYFVPAPDVNAGISRPRSTILFFVCGGLMFLSGTVIAFLAYFGRLAGANLDPLLPITVTAAFLLLAIPTLIFWLVWVHGAHKDLKELTAGHYSISPGQAVGFSFIPLFDAFWIVYMPSRLANAANRHLAGRGLKPIATGGVIACQVISVLAALFLPGLVPLLYGISMWLIQSGLNRLVRPAPAQMAPAPAPEPAMAMPT